MMRSRLLTIVTLVGLAAPLTGIAQSYLTPEQVLEQNDGAFLVPGGRRGAQWAADLQVQQSIDRHPSIIQEPWDPVVDNGLPPAISEDDLLPVGSASVYDTNPYGGLDPLTARLLARLAQQNSILASTAWQNNAPLAGTGPMTTLTVIAMAVATLWTLRKARLLERFVRGM